MRVTPALLFIAATMSATSVVAQSVVTGIVRDSTGIPIAGAAVTIAALNRAAETDAKGEFRLTNVTIGMRMVQVRRVGFTPFSKLVAVADGDNTMPPIVLGRLITRLDTVVSEEQMLWRERPLLREMADNMKIGLGQFVLRKDLEKLSGLRVSTAFRGRNGLMVVTDMGGHAYIASSRGVKSLMNNELMELENGIPAFSPINARLLCYPKVYLDNQPLSVRSNFVPDINQFLPENLEAIEMYAGGAQTPARYNSLNTQCGVIVLHTRPYGKKDR
jgi:hypothetical protein